MILRFPARRISAVVVCRARDDPGCWLVIAPGGHGWLHGDRASARDDAVWLASNLGGVPVRELAA
jgi:hypothetical protein